MTNHLLANSYQHKLSIHKLTALSRMTTRLPLFLLFVLLSLLPVCPAQSQRTLSLSDAIALAQRQSPYYFRAKNTYETGYWQFQNFQAGFKPQIRLNATIPTFFRAINPITQPDGSIQFRRVTQANNSLGVSLVQNIGATGGQLLLGTRLQRTDNFGGAESSYFLSTPVSFSYYQESLLYNDLRWQRKLQPLYFQTAEKNYAEELEEAALQGATLFMATLVAQVTADITAANLANADSLYLLTKERFALGTVAQSDLLQLELNVLKAKNQLATARLNAEASLRNMKRILGIDLAEAVALQEPPLPLKTSLSYEVALEEARSNRQNVLEFSTRRLEAEQKIAEAKGKNSLQFGLSANVGTQQTATSFGGAYRNLQNQQYIGVSLDMPIQDWGLRKSQIRLAEANRELVEVNVQQDELTFEQEIFLQVMRFGQQYDQLALAQKADTVAQQRLHITKERYLVGKVGITDLNLALEENIRAREGYIQSLSAYWLAFYTLRRLTLYDFEKKQSIRYQP
ncbi:TolC family protein [Arundinibacter roseus]|uniref:TolC family protein n=1 Tax=Arundinibacter roseus TaxID=2070510 RepID=A0A4R4KD67_9BACT|nr:TolC family protein [Arundinibacter roseus]TDB65817.1 TolC family protein [Arundinibacter roseus]